MIVAGPSGVGKTETVKQIIQQKSNLIENSPERVMWFYSQEQEELEKSLPNVEFFERPPTADELKSDKTIPKIVVVDDLYEELSADKRMDDIFTKFSHHCKVSVIVILHHIFDKGLRKARINSKYILFHKCPADNRQIQTLGDQVCVYGGSFLKSAYRDATSKPYRFLMIDTQPNTEDEHRYLTDIFHGGDYCFAYVPANKMKNDGAC